MAETLLIVDDEAPVRQTFQEWLEGAGLDCEILTAEDAATALRIANQRAIDLAILDWNLGAGNNGLQLLEDLYLFNPDIVAIMVTGYAHQATPLDAMRMGVRDYLDKNQELNRDIFLAAVRKQLDRIRPAKRERQLHRSLLEFRDAVEKILPLVRTAAAMNDPVPFTESVRSLFRFLLETTGASDGVLLVRSYDPDRQPPEIYRAYNVQGEPMETDLLPFAQSLASAVVSMQEVCALADLNRTSATLGVRLQPFEWNRRNLLAAPLTIRPGLHVVLELFDKQALTPAPLAPSLGQGASDAAPLSRNGGREAGGEGIFTEEDRRLVAAAAEFGAEMLKQALAERQVHGMLLDAVEAALQASQRALQSRPEKAESQQDQPPPAPVLERLRESLQQAPVGVVEADQALKLAELVRVLALRHGREATAYCIQLLEGVDRLLSTVASDK